MPSNHARLSPSGAAKWMSCPASLAAERGLSDVTTIHAQEGTAAHAVAEQLLKAHNPQWKATRPAFQRLAAVDYVGETIEGWTITDDMAAPIQSYVDAVLAIADGKTLHVEQRVDFSHVVGVRRSFGTADAIVINDDELQIHDLKFGRGVKVDAFENPQLQIYALGALRVFEIGTDFNTIRLFIHQPRLNHVSEWALSVQKLKEFGRKVKAAAKKAMACYGLAVEGKPIRPEDFNPSEKACRWCKAAAKCKPHAQHVYELVAGEFVDLDAAEFDAMAPNRLTPEQLAQAFTNIDFIENWCARVRKEAFKHFAEGGSLPGLKIVSGRPGNRKWANEKEAEIVLLNLAAANDDIYTRKLITPTQAEKLLKKDAEAWNQLKPLVTRAEGAPVVVPLSDRRPPLSLEASDDFDVVAS